MRRLLQILPLVAMMATGCAGAIDPAAAPVPAAAALFEPVGLYDFTTSVQGQTIAGVIQIRRTEAGTLTGTISTELTGSMALPRVTLEGTRITMSGDTPNGPVTVNMQVQGQEFSGSWQVPGMEGPLSGRRRS